MPSAAINTTGDVTITGGKLILEGSFTGSSFGVRVVGSHTVDVKDADLTIRYFSFGMRGESSSSAVLNVEASHLDITETTVIGVQYFMGGINLADNVDIVYPNMAKIEGGTIKNLDGSNTKDVEIASTESYYPLSVAGVRVSESNKGDILGDGVFSFDSKTETLTINGDYRYTQPDLILNHITGLTINVPSDVTLTSLYYPDEGEFSFITSTRSLTFTGEGKLTLSSIHTEYGSGIGMAGGTRLTFRNADVEINAFGTGIYANENESIGLAMMSSTVGVDAINTAVTGFKGDVVLQNCILANPDGGSYETGTVLDARGEPAAVAEFCLAYDLWIMGTRVSEINASDILGDGGFSYDPKTNVLTISKSYTNIHSSLIENQISGLTLSVPENVTIINRYNRTNGHVIDTTENMAITGPGRLFLYNEGRVATSSAVYVSGSRLTLFDDAKLMITGFYNGLCGDPENTAALVIRNASLHSDTVGAAVGGFYGGVTLGEDIEIISPKSGVLSEGAVRGADGDPAADVIIEKRGDKEYTVSVFGASAKNTANAGEEVYITAFPIAGKYVSGFDSGGTFTGTIRNSSAGSGYFYFTMSDHDVTLTAVFTDQEPYTIDFSKSVRKYIGDELMDAITDSLGRKRLSYNQEGSYDLNGDGISDIRMSPNHTDNTLEVMSTYSVTEDSVTIYGANLSKYWPITFIYPQDEYTITVEGGHASDETSKAGKQIRVYPDSFEGKYVTGYTSDDVTENIRYVSDYAYFYFTMPKNDVTLTPVFGDQEPYTVNFTTSTEKNLNQGQVNAILTSLGKEMLDYNCYSNYDINDDGVNDIILHRYSGGCSLEVLDTYSAPETFTLDGANPTKYWPITFYYPQEEHSITVTGGTASVTTSKPGREILIYPDAYEDKYISGFTAEGLSLNFHYSSYRGCYYFMMPDADVILMPVYDDKTPLSLDLTSGGKMITAEQLNAILKSLGEESLGYQETGRYDINDDDVKDIYLYNSGNGANLQALDTYSIAEDTFTLTNPNSTKYGPISFYYPQQMHTVSINGGTASPSSARAGTSISVTPDLYAGKYVREYAAEGLKSGNLEPSYSSNLTRFSFTMPQNNVKLTAAYADQEALTIDLTDGAKTLSVEQTAAINESLGGPTYFSSRSYDLNGDGIKDIYISQQGYHYEIKALSDYSAPDGITTITELNATPYWPITVKGPEPHFVTQPIGGEAAAEGGKIKVSWKFNCPAYAYTIMYLKDGEWIGILSDSPALSDANLSGGTTGYAYLSGDWASQEQTTFAVRAHYYTSDSADNLDSATFTIYNPVKYTVGYYLNYSGISAAYLTQQVTRRRVATKPLDDPDPYDDAIPIPHYYTFGGWYTGPECTILYDFSTPVMGNVKLYAKWIEGEHVTVTFNCDGATGITTPDPQTFAPGERAIDPWPDGKISSDGNWQLTYWSVDEAGEVPFDFATDVSEDLTLYARWEYVGTYNVTIYRNGYGFDKLIKVKAGQALERPDDPSTVEYTHLGYYTEPECEHEYDFSLPVNGDLSLYNKWAANPRLTFDAGEGTVLGDWRYVPYNTAPNLGDPFPTPTLTGYTFDAWYEDEGCTVPFTGAAPLTADKTVYANYNINHYTVTFNTLGGSEIAPQDVEYNACATVPDDPTNGTMKFLGWYIDEACTEEAHIISIPITEDTTFYAKWGDGATTYVLCDVNNDGRSNIFDALFVQQYVVRRVSNYSSTLMQADVDYSNNLTVLDATYIQATYTGKIIARAPMNQIGQYVTLVLPPLK